MGGVLLDITKAVQLNSRGTDVNANAMEKENLVESKTNFRNKCLILSDLWLNYRDDENFADFIAYNDIGLPLAYTIANGILSDKKGKEATEETFPIATPFIEEAFNLLLTGLEIEDLEFELLDDVFEAADKVPNILPTEDDYEDEEESDYEADDPETVAWERGWRAGIEAERDRIQGLCEFYTEMYLDEGKGQKAVFWREVADALKPAEEVKEDD